MITLADNCHSNVDMSTCISPHFHVYMVLTMQTAEIQSLLVNTVCFHCHCPGVAAGSLETCIHVIPMPESHNLALVFAGLMYTFNHYLDMHKL